MSNTIIELKHSQTPGNVPATLANGEVSINTADGKFFYKDPSGTIQSFDKFSGPAGLDGEIQFNDSGELGASEKLSFDKDSGELSAEIVKSNSYIEFGDGTRQYTANSSGGGGGESGVSGFSGTSGYSGAPGTSGFSGEQGISGFSGEQGISGFSGFSGFSGEQGISGFSGFSGFSGEQGISGFSGFSGEQGISGFSGYSGISGFSGEQGESGTSGYSGVQGNTGIFIGETAPENNTILWLDESDPNGVGVYGLPAGGNTYQVLIKNSNTDYDVRWGSRIIVSATEPDDPQPGDIWIYYDESQ